MTARDSGRGRNSFREERARFKRTCAEFRCHYLGVQRAMFGIEDSVLFRERRNAWQRLCPLLSVPRSSFGTDAVLEKLLAPRRKKKEGGSAKEND